MESLSRRHVPNSLQELFFEARSVADWNPDDRRRFLERLLARVSDEFAAIGGVAWRFSVDGIVAEAGHRFQESDPLDGEDGPGRHRLFLVSTAAQGQCRYCAPQETPEDLECANPTPFAVLLIPVATAGVLVGVLEFFLSSEASEGRRKQLTSSADVVRALTEDLLLRVQLAEHENGRREAAVTDTFALIAHASLELPRTAYVLANEIRDRVGCDRVGVLVRKRGRMRLEAVSGQDQFDPRANVVRLLETLGQLAARMGEPLVFQETLEETAPEIQEAIYDYLEETHAKQVLILPLRSSRSTAAEVTEECFGAIAVEHLEHVPPSSAWRSRLERLAPHAASALANARECEWPLFASLGRSVRRSRIRKLLNNSKLSSLVLAVVVVVVAWLTFYPADFALQSPGKLRPVVRREVFAEMEGTVQRVYVKHGQNVARGALLMELVNHDLNVAEAELVKQVQETSQEIVNTERELNDANRANAVERGRITARRATAVERLRGLRAQAAFYAEKRRRLRVVSPIDGRIATWNVEELLLMRPVQQGQTLLTVVDPNGEWELELRLPEERLGHVLEAQRAVRYDLPVTFLVAADPYRTYQAQVRDVRLSADVLDVEEGNVVLVRAGLGQHDLPALTLGGEVRAKIHCGSRSLGYVWFHEIYEFFQSQVAFRF